ncbi:hypothetical protein B0H10DRAFT_893207 [Mycena sp. CBHHK59/15]|nr:hypothetical protein B0H10DRAFT_893207 [Mycena sp. CBHHK59/15]
MARERLTAIQTSGPYRGRTPQAPAALLSPTSAALLSPTSTAFELKRRQEVLDEEEGDPIDPAFHSPSRPTSTIDLPPVAPAEPVAEQQQQPEEPTEDSETLRRRTIAERMAKLGGIKFGAAPPVPRARAPQTSEDEQSGGGAVPQDEEQPLQDEEEEERARKERIAAKLAGMGGMRIGMMPYGVGGLPPQQSKTSSPAATLPPHRPSARCRRRGPLRPRSHSRRRSIRSMKVSLTPRTGCAWRRRRARSKRSGMRMPRRSRRRKCLLLYRREAFIVRLCHPRPHNRRASQAVEPLSRQCQLAALQFRRPCLRTAERADRAAWRRPLENRLPTPQHPSPAPPSRAGAQCSANRRRKTS